MSRLVFLTILVALVAGCAGQGFLGRAVGRALQFTSNLLEPIINENYGKDGYRFRYATEDQVREEVGGFENGIWTVRGVVEYLDPERKMKHKETYVADDKGYKAKVEDEPFEGRALSPGALSSLSG